MPRSARLDVLGVVHHVMARGIEGREIFRDDRDREELVRRLVEAEAILGPSRERRITRARAEFYRRAHWAAWQPLADLGRVTGRSQPAVWQVVRRLGSAAGEGKDQEPLQRPDRLPVPR